MRDKAPFHWAWTLFKFGRSSGGVVAGLNVLAFYGEIGPTWGHTFIAFVHIAIFSIFLFFIVGARYTTEDAWAQCAINLWHEVCATLHSDGSWIATCRGLGVQMS